MFARDVMSSPVISIPPSMPVPEIAALLQEHRIGGVPVTARGEVVGIVTESDLIRRHEIGTDRRVDRRPWWRRVQQSDDVAQHYVKTHGRTAGHVMTRNVAVVDTEAELSEVAGLLAGRRIGRVPVLQAGRLAGIVARADLVRMLARRDAPGGQPPVLDDETIRQRLLEELRGQDWWNGAWENVYVTSGVVIFKGVVENEAHRLAARVAAENQEGVRGVQDDRVLASDVPVML